jgi:hypothetical protein
VGEGLFSQLRELNTPEGVPDNAQYLPPGESPPEGATTFPSEGEGKYYVPAGEEADGDKPDSETREPEDITGTLEGLDEDTQADLESGVRAYEDEFGRLPVDEITTEYEGAEGNGARAVYGEGRVEVNPDVDMEKLNDYADRGLLAGKGHDYIIAHEITHLDTQDKPLDFESDEHREILDEKVSRRASMTPGEALAEIGAMKVMGDEIDDDLRDIWNTYTEAEL